MMPADDRGDEEQRAAEIPVREHAARADPETEREQDARRDERRERLGRGFLDGRMVRAAVGMPMGRVPVAGVTAVARVPAGAVPRATHEGHGREAKSAEDEE